MKSKRRNVLEALQFVVQEMEKPELGKPYKPVRYNPLQKNSSINRVKVRRRGKNKKARRGA